MSRKRRGPKPLTRNLPYGRDTQHYGYSNWTLMITRHRNGRSYYKPNLLSILLRHFCESYRISQFLCLSPNFEPTIHIDISSSPSSIMQLRSGATTLSSPKPKAKTPGKKNTAQKHVKSHVLGSKKARKSVPPKSIARSLDPEDLEAR